MSIHLHGGQETQPDARSRRSGGSPLSHAAARRSTSSTVNVGVTRSLPDRARSTAAILTDRSPCLIATRKRRARQFSVPAMTVELTFDEFHDRCAASMWGGGDRAQRPVSEFRDDPTS